MIAILDYRAGNLKSVARALAYLGFEGLVTRDRAIVARAERIVFPGVGAAGEAVAHLMDTGMDRALEEAYREGKPILGICLGTQIVLERSEEDGASCLGLIRGEVRRFPSPLLSPGEGRLKVPHMGWNRMKILRPHPVFEGLRPEDEFYFVHGYYPVPAQEASVFAVTHHGIDFPSVIGEGSLIATQFHPEKSGPPGLRLLKNFCLWGG